MLQLSIITPERTVYDGQVDQVTIQTTEGEITVLPHHIPLVSVLTPGELRMRVGGEETPMVIAGGFVEVLPPHPPTPPLPEGRGETKKDFSPSRGEGERVGVGHGERMTRVAVLADDALRVEEMDVAAIEAAQERARKALEEKRHADDTSFADAAAALQKELARLKVARKYRRGSTAPPASSQPLS